MDSIGDNSVWQCCLIWHFLTSIVYSIAYKKTITIHHHFIYFPMVSKTKQLRRVTVTSHEHWFVFPETPPAFVQGKPLKFSNQIIWQKTRCKTNKTGLNFVFIFFFFAAVFLHHMSNLLGRSCLFPSHFMIRCLILKSFNKKRSLSSLICFPLHLLYRMFVIT